MTCTRLCLEGHTKKNNTRVFNIHICILFKKMKILLFVGEEQDQLQASTVSSEAPPKKKRKKPTCAKCGKPKKGHKAALCIDQS